jgi:hypothetical protein
MTSVTGPRPRLLQDAQQVPVDGFHLDRGLVRFDLRRHSRP